MMTSCSKSAPRTWFGAKLVPMFVPLSCNSDRTTFIRWDIDPNSGMAGFASFTGTQYEAENE
jgi:hypothetical protein